MKNPRAKQPFATLAARLKEIRRRPLTAEQVERLNRVFDEMEKNQKPAQEEKQPGKKIARSPEAEA
jgi:hypothetical protein